MPYPIHSEELEPTAALVIGRMWSRCEEARKGGDDADIESSLKHFWTCARALEWLAIGIRNGGNQGSAGLHFSLSTSANLSLVGRYIESVSGIDPAKEWTWV